eukprot:1198-Heterococcus_DN1.PRE.2
MAAVASIISGSSSSRDCDAAQFAAHKRALLCTYCVRAVALCICNESTTISASVSSSSGLFVVSLTQYFRSSKQQRH